VNGCPRVGLHRREKKRQVHKEEAPPGTFIKNPSNNRLSNNQSTFTFWGGGNFRAAKPPPPRSPGPLGQNYGPALFEIRWGGGGDLICSREGAGT